MKKLLISVSALTLVVSLAFAGCGTKKDGEVSTTSTTTTTTTTASTTTTAKDNDMSSTTSVTDKENLEDKITSAITSMSEKMAD